MTNDPSRDTVSPDTVSTDTVSTDTVSTDTVSTDIVYGLDASPSFQEDARCFAAKRSGLYRSEDGGTSWEDAYESLDLGQPLATAAVSISPAFGRDQTVFAGVHGAVLRSTDGTQTWAAARLPSPPPFVISVVPSPDFERDGVVLAATMEDGVFRSADRGSHWSAWNFGLLDLNVLCLVASPDYARDETLFAGTESGIFKSTNGGRAWREANLPPEWGPVLTLAVSAKSDDTRTVYAGTESFGLIRSLDSGATWEQIQDPRVPETVNGVLLSDRSERRPVVLVMGPESVIFSGDRGHTWCPVDLKLKEGIHLTTVAAPDGLQDGALLLLGTDAGTVLRPRIGVTPGA